MDKPSCYSFHPSGEDEICSECKFEKACLLRTRTKNTPRRSNPRTKGLSRLKAMKAFCWECKGGTNSWDCEAINCPLYPWSPKGEKEPNLWWNSPVSSWSDTYHEKVEKPILDKSKKK